MINVSTTWYQMKTKLKLIWLNWQLRSAERNAKFENKVFREARSHEAHFLIAANRLRSEIGRMHQEQMIEVLPSNIIRFK